MSTVAEKLHKWSVQELNLVAEGGLNRIPDSECLRCLTKGKNKRIWTYVINHVRSKSSVNNVKRTLYLKKLLKEKDCNVLSFNDTSTDFIKLQTTSSKAVEKRTFLTRSLSAIEERILNEEEKIRKVNDEIVRINQKTTLLDLLKQQYDEKNLISKCHLDKILLCAKNLRAYQSDKLNDQGTFPLPYGFLWSDQLVCNKIDLKFNDLIDITSSVIKMKLKKENNEVLIKTLENCYYEFRKKGLLLTEIINLLKAMCSDAQKCSLNLGNVSSKDNTFQTDGIKVLLKQMKYDSVSYSLISAKNKKKIAMLMNIKQETFENKIEDMKREMKDVDEIKYALFETLAENISLVIGNNYLENELKIISDQTEVLLKKIHDEQFHCEELNSAIKIFYQNADMTFYLLYTASDTFQKVFDDLNNLQSFACNELFQSQSFPVQEYLNNLKSYYTLERKLMWDYCDETNLIQPLFSEPYAVDCPLPLEIRKLLNIHSFQSIHILPEIWALFKQKVQTDLVAYAQTYVMSDNIRASEIYANIMKLLAKMKFSIEKGMLFVNDGMICSNKNKTLIQEWWEQNAQFIPPVEYEGKTLKMWIDILGILPDFEPVNYAS